jgi:radical SAM superfamily enzyme YgiQ (UPF0313 family)
MEKVLLLRPYYGVNVHSDMHGDLGVSDYLAHVFPDIYMVLGASLLGLTNHIGLDVIDANAERLFPKQVMDKLSRKYDYIIIKAAAPTVKYDIDFAKSLKGRFQHARVVLTGHVAKIMKSWIEMNVPGVEVSDVPLDDYLYKLFFNNSSRIELDMYPSPDYTMFPYEKYIEPNGVYTKGELHGSLLTSRGCAMGCSYCPYTSYYNGKVEFRSVDKVIDDIEHLLNLGIKLIQFRDQNFTANQNHVEKICKKIIEKKMEFNWKCETRIESLKPELIDIMVDAGMKMIFFGIESASEEILSEFNRKNNISNKKMLSIIEHLNKRSVITGGFYIIGFPNDTWDSIKKTYELSLNLNTTFAKFSIYSPYPTLGSWKEQNLNIPVTPALFTEFDNTLIHNSSKHLSIDELHYAQDMLTMMYYNNSQGLGFTYNDFYIHQKKFRKGIEEIKTALKIQPVIEFDGTCSGKSNSEGDYKKLYKPQYRGCVTRMDM